jgi:hypothetical protein
VSKNLWHWLFSTSNSTRPLLVTDLDLAHLFEVDCVRASFKHDATLQRVPLLWPGRAVATTSLPSSFNL